MNRVQTFSKRGTTVSNAGVWRSVQSYQIVIGLKRTALLSPHPAVSPGTTDQNLTFMWLTVLPSPAASCLPSVSPWLNTHITKGPQTHLDTFFPPKGQKNLFIRLRCLKLHVHRCRIRGSLFHGSRQKRRERVEQRFYIHPLYPPLCNSESRFRVRLLPCIGQNTWSREAAGPERVGGASSRPRTDGRVYLLPPQWSQFTWTPPRRLRPGGVDTLMNLVISYPAVPLLSDDAYAKSISFPSRPNRS
jgi:hypothetical protein